VTTNSKQQGIATFDAIIGLAPCPSSSAGDGVKGSSPLPLHQLQSHCNSGRCLVVPYSGCLAHPTTSGSTQTLGVCDPT
jgi:hypothetical protein